MALTFESAHSSQVLTADGVVGTSGSDTLLFALVVKGGSATTRALLYPGTDASGTLQEDIIAPINNTITINYGERGVFYKGGCYLDITTTAGTVTAIYNQ